MKIKKNKVLWLPRNVTGISLGFCPNEKAYKRLVKEYNVQGDNVGYPESHGAFFALVNSATGSKFGIITMRREIKYQDRQARYALLAHEVFHCFNWLMKTIREDAPSEELGAYLFQYLFTEFARAYKDTK